MVHIRLCKGLSYSGVVSATRERPDVFIEDEAVAAAAIKTGYFKAIEGGAVVPPPTAPTGTITMLDVATIPQLKKYCEDKGIDLQGATKKADILARIREAENLEEDATDQFVGDGQCDADEAQSGQETPAVVPPPTAPTGTGENASE